MVKKNRYFSFELAGSGGLASVNFEKTILDKEKLDLNFRAGFSLFPVDPNNGTVLVFPIMFHAIYGQSAHKVDFGLGQSFSITTKGQSFILMPLSLGYRFEPIDKRYYLRASYTPLFSYVIDRQWQHWGGITFGYKLKLKE